MTPLGKPMLFLATRDAKRSRDFYEKVLGLEFLADEYPALVFRVGELMLRIQKVERVAKAGYTALGWEVADIRKTAKQLRAAGVVFQRYEGLEQDEDNIWRSPSGARVAWFEDPDGNMLSLTQFH
jgi:catechol 2,3-dioxygenase-like lactoylglutathione lyase family enzyme